MSADLFLQLDLPGLLVSVLASVTCALIGTFLVLRRMCMMGDAISHAVLPGIVVAFLLTGSLTSLPTIIGAATAGIITAIGVDVLSRAGRVDISASMGIVFTLLFAAGILLLERAASRSVHIDADCLLYGQLEDVTWMAGTGWSALLDPAALADVPHEIPTLAIVCVSAALLVGLFFKELRITSFDPALAASLGFRPGIVHLGLMVLTAIAVVSSFEAVGSILVIALLICPAGAARMLTDRLGVQVLLSCIIGAACALAGYSLAVFVPAALGAEHSLSASGMISVTAGAAMALAIVFAPVHGIVARRLRRFFTSIRIAHEDLLAMLYRLEEISAEGPEVAIERRHALGAISSSGASRLAAWLALRRAGGAGDLAGPRGTIELSDAGRERARAVVRAHRLWERYLVETLGIRADHVHRPATELEHVRLERLEAQQGSNAGDDQLDPHDRPIPPPVP